MTCTRAGRTRPQAERSRSVSDELERPVFAELPELAERVREEHIAAEQDACSAIAHAIRAGELLIEAKAKVKRVGWLAWLDANVAFTPQTANGYMRLARRREEIEGAPSISAALGELAKPRERKQLPAPDAADEAILAILFDHRPPVPEHFRAARDLLLELGEQGKYYDRQAWLHPPDDFMPEAEPYERQLRWLVPPGGGIESGRAVLQAQNELNEMAVLTARIFEVVPQARTEHWRERFSERAAFVMAEIERKVPRSGR